MRMALESDARKRLSQPRLDEIMRRLGREQRLSVKDLQEDFQVSDETIRRDLKLLEEQGRLRRVHGGAILPRMTEEQPIDVRNRIKRREKAAIARLAAHVIQEGMSIFLDTGTTTLALAHRLVQFRELTVVTNSLNIATMVSRGSENRVVIVPGTIRRNDNAVIGHGSLEWTAGYFYDIAFMGIAGVDVEQGFTDYEEDEAELRRVLIRQAARRIILVDDSKFGRRAHVRTAPLSEVDTIITNAPLPEDFEEKFRAAEVEIIHD